MRAGLLEPTDFQRTGRMDRRDGKGLQAVQQVCSLSPSVLQFSGVMTESATLLSGFEPLNFTGTAKKCLNLGSYNYLGFAAADEYCTPRVQDTLHDLGVSTCSSRSDVGERMIARGKDGTKDRLPSLIEAASVVTIIVTRV